MNLDPWKEELPKPQQFNSESLYPELADLLTDLSRSGGIEEQIFADEAPARPSFSNLATNEKEEEDDLKFINGGDNILQIFRKPSIGNFWKLIMKQNLEYEGQRNWVFAAKIL